MNEDLQKQVQELRDDFEAYKQSPIIPPGLNPETSQVLEQFVAIPYTTTLPTDTPKVNGIRRIYFDATNYWLYVYANGGWRSQKLGIVQGAQAQVFTANGSFTAPSGVTTVYLTMIGGGGGGGGGDGNLARGGGGGGSGGWYTKRPFAVTPGNNYTVTIGAAGTAGGHGTPASPDSGTVGGGGGTTSFDTVSVTGGAGGKHGNSVDGSGPGGVGGTPNGFTGLRSGTQDGGAGASSPFGTGGAGGLQSGSVVPTSGSGYGQGGGGGYDANPSVSGAVGAAGFVLVEW